jgi:hypothetical protein
MVMSSRPSAAFSDDLPLPRDSIQPASHGGGVASRTLATKSIRQRRSRSGFSAPLPFGTMSTAGRTRRTVARPLCGS